MLRYIIGTGVIISLVFPCTTGAYSIMSGGENIRIEKPINDNIYAAGGNVDSVGSISGDGIFAGGDLKIGSNVGDNALLFGGDIETNGIIQGDLFAAGGSIRIKSPVYGDIRAAGGKISLEQSASGDVNLAGGDMSIAQNVSIGKDMSIAGGKAVLYGNIGGKADIIIGELDLDAVINKDVYLDIYDGSKIHIGPNAKILGKLTYKSKDALPELEKIATQGAVYLGASDFSDKDKNHEELYGIIAGYIIYKFLFLLIVGSIILGLFNRNITSIATTLKKHIGKSFIFGILYFILTPIIAILLCITVIGIPVGILTFAIYGFTFLFAKLIVLLVGSSLINHTWSNIMGTPWKKWGVFFILALLLSLVNGIDIILVIFAVGAIVIHTIDIFEKRNI